MLPWFISATFMVLLFQCPTDSLVVHVALTRVSSFRTIHSTCWTFLQWVFQTTAKKTIFKIELFLILWTVVLLSLHFLFKVALAFTQLSKLGNSESIILAFYFLSLIQSLKKSFLSSNFFFSFLHHDPHN